jgi:hypothetical protein
MKRSNFISIFLVLNILLSSSYAEAGIRKNGDENITPNQFKGSDIQRIRLAIDAAKGTTNKVFIPSANSNGTNIWLIDSAIVVPGNMTVILDNCTIQLSDSCRDNMFRSDNIETSTSDPKWNNNISIIGVGNVILKGAANPRATGDGGKTLGKMTYGSDAGKAGRKQTGDSRNIMIRMVYVDGFTIKNVNVENSHMWAFSFEWTVNADISDIRIINPVDINVNGQKVRVLNKDGIDLRQGCKNFRIENISGMTGDDFIALTNFYTPSKQENPEKDIIEQISISNITCESVTRAIAIRAKENAGIRNVFINGVKYKGRWNAILVGGKGYGNPNLPGSINNIHAMNIVGNGYSLIHIEEAIADCSFLNCVYTGGGDQVISYNVDKNRSRDIIPKDTLDKAQTKNVITKNLIKIP